MKNLLLPVILLAFLITSCEKEEPVSITATSKDEIRKKTDEIMDRIRLSTDPKAEIRRINEEHGRYTDDDGNTYFSKDDYEVISKARQNPNARTAPIYNEISMPQTNQYGGVAWYWDDNAWQYLGPCQGSAIFVNCPSGFQLCNDYNLYAIQIARHPWTVCQTNCCGFIYGTFWEGSTKRDTDTWKPSYSQPTVNDFWEMRIRNSLYTGPCCFSIRQYVLNNNCSNGQPFGAGPKCGYVE